MTWERKRCLVTGGASFIGSHVVEALLAAGATVRVADDLSSGLLENLSGVMEDIDFVKGDLKRIDFARLACSDIDRVFHLAADHGGRGYIATHPANCVGNMALDNIVFEAATKAGAEHILFASSACVYPTDAQDIKQLLREDMVSFEHRGGAFADEEYGWAKLMGELALRAYHRQYGIKAAAARISTAYGPRENESHALIALVAKAFIKQTPLEIWGDGTQSRGFTYVDDVARGLILAAEHIEDGTAVNVGTSDFVSLNEAAAEVLRSFDWHPPDGIKHLTGRPVGVRHRALDGTYAQARLGWTPQVSLREGVERTVHWYRTRHTVDDVAQRLETLLMQRADTSPPPRTRA